MRCLNLALILLAGIFYLTNRLVLQTITGGWLHWFLVCYANDLFAGLAIVAWTIFCWIGAACPLSAPGSRQSLFCLSAVWCGRCWPPCGRLGRFLTPGISQPIRPEAYCGSFWPAGFPIGNNVRPSFPVWERGACCLFQVSN